MVDELEELETNLENLDIFEIAMAKEPAQKPFKDGSFLLLKSRGDENMPEKEEKQEESTEKTLEDLLMEAFEKEEVSIDEDFVETIAQAKDSSPSDVWETLLEIAPDELTKEEETEKEEEEKTVSPKVQSAVKNVLSDLTEVRSEIPAQHQWIFSALAKMAGYPSPYGQSDYGYPSYTNYGYPKVAEKELEGETQEIIEESINTLEKIDEISEEGGWVIDSLSQLVKEEKDMTDFSKYVDKEIQPEIEKMQDALKEKEERVARLEKEKLEKELVEKASEFEHVPASTEDLVELFKGLHGSEAFDKVLELLSQVNKEAETSELIKSKGKTGAETKPSKAIDKLEKEAEKKAEEEGIDFSKAMTEIIQTDKDLREQYAKERGV